MITPKPFPHRFVRAFALVLAGLLAAPLSAQSQRMAVSRNKVTPDPEQENRLPPELRDLGWEQNLGAAVPENLVFTDHNGNEVEFADLLGKQPVILAPVYYECPMLCSLVLDGVTRGLKPLKFGVGDEFRVVALSIDPREDAELAAATRQSAISRYGRDEADPEAWTFLTGEKVQIDQLTDAVGFKYAYDERTGLYNHAGGVVLLTPDGRVSRYFYGVDYAPRDLRLGLVEAADEKIGNVVDQILLFCYQYDPALGKYSTAVTNIVRAAGVLTVVAMALFILMMLRREQKEPAHA